MKWFKQKWLYVVLILFLIGEFIFSKDWFFIEALFFGLLVKLFLDVNLSKNLRAYLQLAIWGTVIASFGLTIYGNYILKPVPTPDWLEYLRSNAGILTGFALIFLGIISHKTGDSAS